jgi:hypothetical protein
LLFEVNAGSPDGIIRIESLNQLKARHEPPYVNAKIVDVLDRRLLPKFLETLPVTIPFTLQGVGNEV